MISGNIRPVDKVGRVSIPASIRKVLALVEGDQVEFGVSGNRVYLERYNKSCLLCGSDKDLSLFQSEIGDRVRDVYLCRSCQNKLREAKPIREED